MELWMLKEDASLYIYDPADECELRTYDDKPWEWFIFTERYSPLFDGFVTIKLYNPDATRFEALGPV